MSVVILAAKVARMSFQIVFENNSRDVALRLIASSRFLSFADRSCKKDDEVLKISFSSRSRKKKTETWGSLCRSSVVNGS